VVRDGEVQLHVRLVQVVAALKSAFLQNIVEPALGQATWRTLFNGYGVIGLALLVLGFLYIRKPVPVFSDRAGGAKDFFVSALKGMGDVVKVARVDRFVHRSCSVRRDARIRRRLGSEAAHGARPEPVRS
jgi:hypothetical protein